MEKKYWNRGQPPVEKYCFRITHISICISDTQIDFYMVSNGIEVLDTSESYPWPRYVLH